MRLDVLGMSETRCMDNGKITDNKKVMVYARGEEHRYGVGIIMNKKPNGLKTVHVFFL